MLATVSKRALDENADEQSPHKRKRDSAEDEDSDDDDRSQRERSGSPVSRPDRTPSPETDNRRLDQDLELEMQRDLAGMPTFPLPSGPAKASAKMLSMQGLPAALKDAERVSQELRISIDDLHVQSRRKSQISKGEDETEQDRLGSRIRKRLRDTGVEEFFAGEYSLRTLSSRADYTLLLVQTALLPELAGLPLVPHPDEFLHDYLVSAPTGSGKTLSYVVPLIEVRLWRSGSGVKY
jgi:ATP-dependent RNA helicase DDX51/DBP6